jgi:hypothetical protein
MTDWNCSPELMERIRASITPIETDTPLSQVLMEDFPEDCSNLPIAGGWGYSQGDAILFVLDRFRPGLPLHFIPLEKKIALKVIYEELIVFRPEADRFSGINMELKFQTLKQDVGRKYDCLTFGITCWSDLHWQQLKTEFEENDFGTRAGFDLEKHAAKRNASQVQYERILWFDITDVFDADQKRQRGYSLGSGPSA